MPSLGDVASVVGLVLGPVGLASAYWTWDSHRRDRLTERAYDQLFRKALREWEGDYNEEQVKALSQQFQELQDQIRIGVPAEARRVFVQERLDSLGEQITALYSEYQSLLAERGSQPGQLDPSIAASIERTIRPNYLVRSQRQQLMFGLLIAIVVLAALSLTFNFPYGRRVILEATAALTLLVPEQIDAYFVQYPREKIAATLVLTGVIGIVLQGLAGGRVTRLVRRAPRLCAILAVGAALVGMMLPPLTYSYIMDVNRGNTIATEIAFLVATAVFSTLWACLFLVIGNLFRLLFEVHRARSRRAPAATAPV